MMSAGTRATFELSEQDELLLKSPEAKQQQRRGNKTEFISPKKVAF